MKHIPFGWADPGSLRHELSRPIQRISALFIHLAWRGASNITLWRFDGSGLRIFSRMHEVLPRLEVGVLNFELISTPDPADQIIGLRDRFCGELRTSRLVITESGVTAECGIVLTGKGEIAIVAGSFPLTLALRGVEFNSPAWEPEYPWDEYEQLDV